MLTVEEARSQILSRVHPLGTERIDLPVALGRVLSEPMVSTREIPPWPNSSMDGYAIRAEDTRHGPVVLSVVGRVAAGDFPDRSVGPLEAMRIFTGAPMPDGADAVVPQEDVEVQGGGVRVPGGIRPSACVRPRGEDAHAGDVLLRPGHVIGPAEIGLLAALGHARVPVYRRPRVAILSTGNELADLGVEPGRGQIPNTNSFSLMALVLEAGGEPLGLGIAADDPAALDERLRWGLSADVLITSAGVSVGEADLVKDALVHAGAELHLWQVSMRPGKPITFGSIGERLVFGLPGNPVSAMVTFELFVRPALRAMTGCRSVDRPVIRAVAATRIENPGFRRGYLRVTLERRDGVYLARLTGDQGSAILTSMVAADGLAIVAGDATVEPGESVNVMVLRRLPA